jgi:hypothetical protein
MLNPGESIEYTSANSDPNYDMKINSRLYFPASESVLRANTPFIAKGVAWNDGAAELTSVELSIDQGHNWQSAVMARVTGPFAFRGWTMTISLPVGRHQIWVRAADARGRTQPIDGGIFWNTGGYAWNGVEKVSVSVE